jgi:hypothetical protein
MFGRHGFRPWLDPGTERAWVEASRRLEALRSKYDPEQRFAGFMKS